MVDIDGTPTRRFDKQSLPSAPKLCDRTEPPKAPSRRPAGVREKAVNFVGQDDGATHSYVNPKTVQKRKRPAGKLVVVERVSLAHDDEEKRLQGRPLPAPAAAPPSAPEPEAFPQTAAPVEDEWAEAELEFQHVPTNPQAFVCQPPPGVDDAVPPTVSLRRLG